MDKQFRIISFHSHSQAVILQLLRLFVRQDFLGMFMIDELKKSFVIFFLAESRLLLSVTKHKYLSSVLSTAGLFSLEKFQPVFLMNCSL